MSIIVVHGAKSSAIGAGLGAIGSGLSAGLQQRQENERAKALLALQQAAAKRAEEDQAYQNEQRAAAKQAGQSAGDYYSKDLEQYGKPPEIQGPPMLNDGVGPQGPTRSLGEIPSEPGLSPDEIASAKRFIESMPPEYRAAAGAKLAETFKGRVADQALGGFMQQLSETVRMSAQDPNVPPEFQQQYAQLGAAFEKLKDPRIDAEQKMRVLGLLESQYGHLVTAQQKEHVRLLQEQDAKGALEAGYTSAPEGSPMREQYGHLMASLSAGLLTPRAALTAAHNIQIGNVEVDIGGGQTAWMSPRDAAIRNENNRRQAEAERHNLATEEAKRSDLQQRAEEAAAEASASGYKITPDAVTKRAASLRSDPFGAVTQDLLDKAVQQLKDEADKIAPKPAAGAPVTGAPAAGAPAPAANTYPAGLPDDERSAYDALDEAGKAKVRAALGGK